MGGCDKTTPALLMGAISMNLPAIYMPGGPMLRGNWRDQTLGSGSDVWKYWAELRAGNITDGEWQEIENGIARSPGHCMTMGTASTMTSASEALGFTLPGAASIPAADSRHARMASDTGRRAVEMVWEDLKPRDFLTAGSFDNAVTAVLAIGGSTNALVHLIALARRAGVPLTLDRFDQLSRSTPLIANIRPAGKYLMEDFFYAGGLRALLSEIDDLLDLDARTVNGRTLGENVAGAEVFNRDVILERDKALVGSGSLAVLRGNVAPESFVGGPLAFVRDGDLIELDVEKRSLQLKVDDADLARRRASWKKPAPRFERGYGALYQQHITQADQGCDFDFLEGTAPTAEPEIH